MPTEFFSKPPVEVERNALRYVKSWNATAGILLATNPNTPGFLDKAEKLLQRADFVLDQLSQANIHSPANFAALEKVNRIVETTIQRRINTIQAQLEKARQTASPGVGEMSDLERELRHDPLYGVMTEMETTEVHGDARDLIYRRLIAEKAKKLVDDSPPALWIDAEKTAFLDLIMKAVEPLIEYGLFTTRTLSTGNITVKDSDSHLKILSGGLEKSGSALSTAISFNHEFNTNPLVDSVGIDAEMFKSDMGVIQAICCVAYHLMKTKGSPGHAGFSTFAKTVQYAPGQSNGLIEFICSKDDWTVTDARGMSHIVPVKSMIDRYPEEVKKILKHIALLKASRDDLGQHASNWIMFKNGNSPKLAGTGSNGKEYHSGLMARMVYDVANTSATGIPKVQLSFIDVTGIREKPLDFSAIIWKKKNPLAPGGPVLNPAVAGGDTRALTIFREMLLLDNLFEAEHPGYKTHARGDYNCRPAHWYSDFPALHDFMNQDIRKPHVVADAYLQARASFLKIITESARSVGDSYPVDRTALSAKINTKLRMIFSQYAIFTALGPGFADPSAPWSHEYIHYHRIPRAALKFMIFNIINSLPATQQSGVDSFWSKLINPLKRTENKEAYEVRRQAVEIIDKQIRQYTSLGDPTKPGTCAHELIEFLESEWLVNIAYRSQQDVIQEYNINRLAITGEPTTNEEINRLVTRHFSIEPPPKE